MKEILAKWSATIESNLTEKRKIILHSRHIIVPLVVYHIYLQILNKLASPYC